MNRNLPQALPGFAEVWEGQGPSFFLGAALFTECLQPFAPMTP